MAIQMRRGLLENYDETKMVAGELAVTTDTTDENQQIFVAFAPGDSKRILTETDLTTGAIQNVWTGKCSNSASATTKVITLDNADGFTLTNGATIGVFFGAGNDADNISLNVNSTGACTVRIGTASSGSSTTGAAAKWGSGIQFFTYQSPYWIHSSADPRAINILSNTKADIASPALTGTPTAPTATSGTNTTQIATTAFVQAAITSGITITDPNNDGHLVITIGGE